MYLLLNFEHLCTKRRTWCEKTGQFSSSFIFLLGPASRISHRENEKKMSMKWFWKTVYSSRLVPFLGGFWRLRRLWFVLRVQQSLKLKNVKECGRVLAWRLTSGLEGRSIIRFFQIADFLPASGSTIPRLSIPPAHPPRHYKSGIPTRLLKLKISLRQRRVHFYNLSPGFSKYIFFSVDYT